MFGDKVSNKSLSDLITGSQGKAPEDSWLHKLHERISPFGMGLSMLGKVGGAAAPGMGMTTPDILPPNEFTRSAGMDRVKHGWDQFAPQSGTAPPMLPTPPTPTPVDMGTPAAPPPPALSAQALAPQSAPPVPMPMARPPEAPQATPDMGFFARNAAMMQDPSSGAFLDPTAAQSAQASGPDLINKLMSYFHDKKDNA